MIILGIDPGTSRLGYGLIKKGAGGISIVDYGCFRTKTRDTKESKLKQIHIFISGLIKKYRPEVMVIEKLFFFKNKKTVLDISEARGVIISAASLLDIKITEYTPLQIKQAVTGQGRAEKRQVQKMVQLILKLKELPEPDDAADALAAAICYSSITKI